MLTVTDIQTVDIKGYIRDNGIPQYQIADESGFAESTICKWLRSNLKRTNEKNQNRVIDAINRLSCR